MVFGVLQYGKRPYVSFPGGSINVDNYENYLADFFVDEDFGFEKDVDFFQQDGAPAHRALETLYYLQEFCGDLVMAQDFSKITSTSPIPEWTPRSPDLNPLDYFFWGYLKQCLNKLDGGWPRSEETMKEAIELICEEMPQDMINNAILDFPKRCKNCLDRSGGHFEHLL